MPAPFSRIRSLLRAIEDTGPGLYWAFLSPYSKICAGNFITLLTLPPPGLPHSSESEGEVEKGWEVGIIILTMVGKEGMGDELGVWLAMFRALNLGTTATLTLRRGMFCGKRSDQAHCQGGSSHSSERFGKCLLVSDAIITFTGYFGFGLVMVLRVHVKKLARVDASFLLVVSDFSKCSYFSL